ncbi:MAG: signal peptide peptidase SppA [Leptospiraceae bacterium]|nr:signal peptide peptidase SppA [Leptospiraceae bacterium]
MNIMMLKKASLILFSSLVLSSCLSPRDLLTSMFQFRPDYTLERRVIYQTVRGPDGCLIPNHADGKILLIPIQGVIQSTGYISNSTVSPAFIERLLQNASDEGGWKAVILYINSPGGTVTASHQIYRQIQDFSKKNELKVHAHINSLGASGAYYISMAADEISAEETARVGSIGVIMRSISLQGLLEKYGIRYQAIASGANKDTGSIFKDISPEEEAFLKSQISVSYERFLQIILESRKDRIGSEKLRQVADGRVYLAAHAKNLGLIDQLAEFPGVVAQLGDKYGSRAPEVVTWLPRDTQAQSIYDLELATQSSAEYQLEVLRGLAGQKMFYIWPDSFF